MARWSYRARIGTNGHATNPVSKGYAVELPKLTIAEKYVYPTARLTNQANEDMFLWIFDVEQDFSMGGSTAQSVDRRQFFPNNFNQPSVRIKGITGNNKQYNELAEFVRETQLAAVTQPFWTTNTDPFITLTIPKGGYNLDKKSSADRVINRGNIKGDHGTQIMEGYIKKITGGATRFEFAKEYNFEFVISRYQTGLFTENAARIQALQQITGVIKNNKQNIGGAQKPFISNTPNPTQNKPNAPIKNPHGM